jgi:hypothetical protein
VIRSSARLVSILFTAIAVLIASLDGCLLNCRAAHTHAAPSKAADASCHEQTTDADTDGWQSTCDHDHDGATPQAAVQSRFELSTDSGAHAALVDDPLLALATAAWPAVDDPASIGRAAASAAFLIPLRL